MRPQVRPNIAITNDDVPLPDCGTLARFQEQGAEFRENRNEAFAAVFVAFQFRRAHANLAVGPINVFKQEAQHFGRTTKTAKASQREDQSPIKIGAGVENGLSHFASYEEGPRFVDHARYLHVGEGIRRHQFPPESRREKLSGVLKRSRYRRTGVLLARKKNIEEKKMFGCICFFMNGNALVGAWKDRLIARLGPDEGELALLELHVRAFDITGKPMRKWVAVESEGVEDDSELKKWIERAVKFVKTLPKK